MSRNLRILSRKGCHLCDKVIEPLAQMAAALATFTVEIIDVDTNEGLAQEYGLLIPVVLDGDNELFRYGMDTIKLEQWLENC
ncbi:MAG TPA: glutaredoxin family protein [Burkholderiales bacterium]|nr:glutaredoxin family protein [Pseudomonadota bacterium]HVC50056.1 glutaredoxin family protein [Burkholderiales bacterium]